MFNWFKSKPLPVYPDNAVYNILFTRNQYAGYGQLYVGTNDGRCFAVAVEERDGKPVLVLQENKDDA